MPVIQIDIRKGRTRKQIRALQKREYVYVLVREEEGANHALAGRPLPEWKPTAK
ncbi:MAG: hypothetical protein HYW93_05160 [Thaumarchaeota archaeon]|nr:hypothetical protein [Nitrososphaerota archaeon]